MTEATVRDGYFEDFEVGQVFTGDRRTVTEAAVDTFAGLTGDFSYLHVDAEAAAESIYGERIIHGLLSLSLLQGLMWQTHYTRRTGVASLGWEAIKWPAPVRIGDTVQAGFSIREMRESKSRPDLGILVEDCRLTNQRGEVVCTGDHILMVRRRPAQG
jgi:acyl dehydratase